MRPWHPEQKADFCRSFLASGESQEHFCQRCRDADEAGAPSARSLRDWLRVYRDPDAVRAEGESQVSRVG